MTESKFVVAGALGLGAGGYRKGNSGEDVRYPVIAVTASRADPYDKTHPIVRFKWVRFIASRLFLNEAGPETGFFKKI